MDGESALDKLLELEKKQQSSALKAPPSSSYKYDYASLRKSDNPSAPAPAPGPSPYVSASPAVSRPPSVNPYQPLRPTPTDASVNEPFSYDPSAQLPEVLKHHHPNQRPQSSPPTSSTYHPYPSPPSSQHYPQQQQQQQQQPPVVVSSPPPRPVVTVTSPPPSHVAFGGAYPVPTVNGPTSVAYVPPSGNSPLYASQPQQQQQQQPQQQQMVSPPPPPSSSSLPTRYPPSGDAPIYYNIQQQQQQQYQQPPVIHTYASPPPPTTPPAAVAVRPSQPSQPPSLMVSNETATTFYPNTTPVVDPNYSPGPLRQRKPSLGCTLLVRPDDFSGGKKHAFVLVSSLSNMTCAFCQRVRTSSKAYRCTECGFTVHKRCATLCPPRCTGTVKTSNEPVAFMSSQAKHRGLRAINFTSEQLDMQGYLMKQGREGSWNKRFFVLCHGDEYLYYFSSKPQTDLVNVVPSGGFPLFKASVTGAPQATASFQYCLSLQHSTLDRSIILATETADELNMWIKKLNEAIGACEVLDEASGLNGPASNNWSSLTPTTKRIFVDDSLDHANVMADRRRCFKDIMCFDADLCVQQKVFLKIDGLFDYTDESDAQYFVSVRVYYAGHNVVSELSTDLARIPKWDNRWHVMSDSIAHFPPESVMMVSAYKVSPDKQQGLLGHIKSMTKREGDGITTCIGHCHLPLTDYGVFKSGTFDLRLMEGEGSPIHFHFGDEKVDATRPSVRITLPQWPMAIVYGSFFNPLESVPNVVAPNPGVSPLDAVALRADLPNPLMVRSGAEQAISWQQRNTLPPSHLPLILAGCNFTSPSQRQEVKLICEKAYRAGIPVATALHLLSSEFSSSYVRAYAARALLESISSEALLSILLVCCSALRFEPFDWSHLAELMIRRVIQDRRLTHAFFWGLVGQSDPSHALSPRFIFLRKALQSQLGSEEAGGLVREAQLVKSLCDLSSHTQRKANLSALMKPFASFGVPIRLPFSSEFLVSGVNVDKCKLMTSNAAPIWVPFIGIDYSPKVIVKSGDDLRQDEFALLFANLLNKIWQRNPSCKSRIVTYSCVTTSDRVGMIEVVDGCTSLATVQGSVMGALKKDLVTQFLGSKVGPGVFWNGIIENFIATLSGSCIFEYILGIGDRHGDNILLKNDGSIFHIDFAYLMGNKTYFGGVSRETQPFTFTPSFLDVLGGKQSKFYAEFVRACCDSFNEVRKHHVFLTGICMLALGSSMPHLRKVDDVHYMRDALKPGLNDDEAATLWVKLLNEALETKRTQLNDAAHNLVAAFKK